MADATITFGADPGNVPATVEQLKQITDELFKGIPISAEKAKAAQEELIQSWYRAKATILQANDAAAVLRPGLEQLSQQTGIMALSANDLSKALASVGSASVYAHKYLAEFKEAMVPVIAEIKNFAFDSGVSREGVEQFSESLNDFISPAEIAKGILVNLSNLWGQLEEATGGATREQQRANDVVTELTTKQREARFALLDQAAALVIMVEREKERGEVTGQTQKAVEKLTDAFEAAGVAIPPTFDETRRQLGALTKEEEKAGKEAERRAEKEEKANERAAKAAEKAAERVAKAKQKEAEEFEKAEKKKADALAKAEQKFDDAIAKLKAMSDAEKDSGAAIDIALAAIMAETEAVGANAEKLDHLTSSVNSFAKSKRDSKKAVDEHTEALKEEVKVLEEAAKSAQKSAEDAQQKVSDAEKRIGDLESKPMLTPDEQQELNDLLDERFNLYNDVADATENAAQAEFEYGNAHEDLVQTEKESLDVTRNTGSAVDALTKAFREFADEGVDEAAESVDVLADSQDALADSAGDAISGLGGVADIGADIAGSMPDVADGIGKVTDAVDGLNKSTEADDKSGFAGMAKDASSLKSELLPEILKLIKEIREEASRVTLGGGSGGAL